MTEKLKLTYSELKEIVHNNLERFEVLFDDIPPCHPEFVHDPKDPGSSNSKNYRKGNTSYNMFEFKDLETGIEYGFQYSNDTEYGFDFPLSFLSDPPNGIEFVTKSVLFPESEPVAVVPVLTEAEQKDKKLMAFYKENINREAFTIIPSKGKIPIPPKEVKRVTDFLKTKNYSLYDVKQMIIPLCIEYKVTHESFWNFLQVKLGYWKA